jgi:hypothetical protein
MALRNIAAAGLSLALLAAPVFAQTPPPAQTVKSPADLSEAQMDELYCVYDAMSANPKDADVVAESITTADKDAAAKARAIHEAARKSCVDKYKWSAEQASVAGSVATSAILADLTEDELRARGLNDKTFEAVMGISDKLSPADFDALLSMGQGKADEAMLTRVRKHLTDAGVPADKDTVEIALAFLQGSMSEYDGVLVWVDQKFY